MLRIDQCKRHEFRWPPPLWELQFVLIGAYRFRQVPGAGVRKSDGRRVAAGLDQLCRTHQRRHDRLLHEIRSLAQRQRDGHVLGVELQR